MLGKQNGGWPVCFGTVQLYSYTMGMTDASAHDYAAAGGYPSGLVSPLAGLPVDVIRAWERRYGLPRPSRSVGGHRLYRPRGVVLLRRAAALRAQGLTAAAACAQALGEAARAETVPEAVVGSTLTARLSARLHHAAATLDAAQAGAVLAEAGALLDVETLWRQVMAPALNRLGADWAHGTLTPAPEHLLSSVVRGVGGDLPGRGHAHRGVGGGRPHAAPAPGCGHRHHAGVCGGGPGDAARGAGSLRRPVIRAGLWGSSLCRCGAADP